MIRSFYFFIATLFSLTPCFAAKPGACKAGLELKKFDPQKQLAQSVLDITQNRAFLSTIVAEFTYAGELTQALTFTTDTKTSSILDDPVAAAEKLTRALINKFGRSNLSSREQGDLEIYLGEIFGKKNAQKESQQILAFSRALAQDENYKRAVEDVLAIWLVHGAEAAFLNERSREITTLFFEPNLIDAYVPFQFITAAVGLFAGAVYFAEANASAGKVAMYAGPFPTYVLAVRWGIAKALNSWKQAQLFLKARKVQKLAANEVMSQSRMPVVVSVESPLENAPVLEARQGLEQRSIQDEIEALSPKLEHLTFKGLARYDAPLRALADILSLEVLRFAERLSVLYASSLKDQVAGILENPVKPKRFQVAAMLGEPLTQITQGWAQALDEALETESLIRRLLGKLSEFENYLGQIQSEGVPAGLQEVVKGKSLFLKLTGEQLQNSLARLAELSKEVSKRSLILESAQRAILSRTETDLDDQSLKLLQEVRAALTGVVE